MNPIIHFRDRLPVLAERANRIFLEKFGVQPTSVGLAPGRVNLIGEHTDYNDGFAMPMAIDRYTTVVGAVSADGVSRVYSEQFGDGPLNAELPLTPALSPAQSCGGEGEYGLSIDAVCSGGEGENEYWQRYIGGVIQEFRAMGHEIPPLNLVVCSNVPVGGGVSSSAALEIATAYLIQRVLGSHLDGMEFARLCQQAEHNHAGVPCGVMDQISSVFGRAGNLMLLDCRSLEIEYIPVPVDEVSILVVNSNVRHNLVDGEYRTRREQCEVAAKALGVSALRDANLIHLENNRAAMPELVFRRARHVISENARTVEAASRIRQRDWETVGQLMYASHDSLRVDYGVTCPETDTLVEIARSRRLEQGVYGSRMTGGGFGGCTVSLVRSEQASNIGQVLAERYFGQTGILADWFVSAPADGALLVNRLQF